MAFLVWSELSKYWTMSSVLIGDTQKMMMMMMMFSCLYIFKAQPSPGSFQQSMRSQAIILWQGLAFNF